MECALPVGEVGRGPGRGPGQVGHYGWKIYLLVRLTSYENIFIGNAQV